MPGTAAGGERGAEEQDAVEERNAADADANNSNAVDISSKPGSASVKSQHVDDDALAASKSSKGLYFLSRVKNLIFYASLNYCTNYLNRVVDSVILHCVSKKVPTFKLSATLSNLNQF